MESAKSFFNVSHTFLLFFAFLVWLCGCIACGDLSRKLLEPNDEFESIQPTELYGGLSAAVAMGLLLGGTFFWRLAIGNIDRIDALVCPKIWQAYRLKFYIFLILFDGGSALTSMYLANDAISRLCFGCLDVCVCVALSLSLMAYPWRYFRNFGQFRDIQSINASLLLDVDKMDDVSARGEESSSSTRSAKLAV